MENMKRVNNILNQLRATSSTNAKAQILQDNVNDELLQKVLYYTLNPFYMYGLTVKTLNEEFIPESLVFAVPGEDDVFTLLDKLASSNINDALRHESKLLLMRIEDEGVREMVQGIMVKDLKIGIHSTGVNKVWKKLIPKFEVQLAESLLKKGFDKTIKGKNISVTPKLDGFRIMFNPLKQEFFTRQGQKYEGIDHLLEECNKAVQLVETMTGKKVMLDGELIYEEVPGMTSLERYSLTSSVARKKGFHSDKLKLQLNLFDIITVEEFEDGKGTWEYSKRRSIMDSVLNDNTFKNIIKVPVLYNGIADEELIMYLLDEAKDRDEEGLMVNVNDSVYECKRTKNLLKVKTFSSADVLVTGVYEGEIGSEFEGTLGGVNVQFLYNGEIMETNVGGSSFYKDERELIFNNPETIIGKIIEINYFEVSSNKKDKTKKSLRFATYQHRIREDKTADDITDVAITD